MFRRRASSFSSLFDTGGRSVQAMRAPALCVTGWLRVALMWQVAQVGAAV